jgi:AraC-like DNA-binding protein
MDGFTTSQFFNIIAQTTPLLVSCCFIILAFFLKKRKTQSDIIHNIFILFLAIIQLEFVLVYIGEKAIALYMMILFVPVFQSLPIIQYLYIKSLSSITRPGKQSFIHFIFPVLSAFVITVILLFFRSFVEKDAFWIMLGLMILGGALVTNIIYIPKSIKVYRQHKRNAGDLFSYQSGVDLKWMRLAIAGYVLFILSIAFIEIVTFKGDSIVLNVIHVTYLFYLLINGLRQKPISQVLYSNFDYKKPLTDSLTTVEKSDTQSIEKEFETEFPEKYKTSSLKDDNRIEQIADQLQNYLENKKAYLDPRLNLMDVSRELGINYKYISQAINHKFGKNFISLISEYRIDEAKKMIINQTNLNLTLEAIGELCGFQSKSTFFIAFKKITGLTPMQFKEQNFKQKVIN